MRGLFTGHGFTGAGDDDLLSLVEQLHRRVRQRR